MSALFSRRSCQRKYIKQDHNIVIHIWHFLLISCLVRNNLRCAHVTTSTVQHEKSNPCQCWGFKKRSQLYLRPPTMCCARTLLAYKPPEGIVINTFWSFCLHFPTWWFSWHLQLCGEPGLPFWPCWFAAALSSHPPTSTWFRVHCGDSDLCLRWW